MPRDILNGLLYFLVILKLASGSASHPAVKNWIKSTGYNGYKSILSDVNKIQYSSNYVYVSANGIPGTYTIGPSWADNPGIPSAQSYVIKIPLNPKPATTNKTSIGLNSIGVLLNGVTTYNADDGQSYNNRKVWYRNAYFWEGPTFDSCSGHPGPGGIYHHHVAPGNCLFTLTDSTKHSPLLGYAFDGYPIYGAYGYSNANDSTSAIKLLKSCYVTPASYPLNIRTQFGNGTTISNAANYGPNVNTTYPIGSYLLDWYYSPSASCDLNEFNGRFQKTPEYPNGTFCYIATMNATGTPTYPFIYGPGNYYGEVASTSVKNQITESVTTYWEYSSTNRVTISAITLTIAFIISLL